MGSGERTRTATVHVLAGLNGSGKSTHARRLEKERPAVRFSLDEWMLRLHQIRYDDPSYPALADRCVSLIWDTAQQVLVTGTDVVLDWNQWSRARRRFWRERAGAAGHRLVLHHLTAPLDTAIHRAEQRANLAPSDSHNLDAAAVRHLADLFESPTPDEGIEVRIVND
ncbi:MAG: AAA family ATPase [Nocardioidaceae bacterium]